MKKVLLGFIISSTSIAYAGPGDVGSVASGMSQLSQKQQTVLKALQYHDEEVFYEGKTIARKYHTNVPDDLDTYKYVGQVNIPCVVAVTPYIHKGIYYGLKAEIDTPKFLIDENVGREIEKVRWGRAEGFGTRFMATSFSDRNVSEKLTLKNNTLYFEYVDSLKNLTKVALQLDQNRNVSAVDVSEYKMIFGMGALKNKRHSLSCHNLKRVDKKRYIEIINSEI